uniref:Uncharacterized protein n=1 Tax=Panagrolaimus sp. ES5 TaxID=591445 RepID=A0AC34FHQ3_9BILA
MSKNAGHLIASDIVAEMFQQYMKKKQEEVEKDFNGCTDILATVTDIDKEKMFDTIRSASDDSGYGNDDINDNHKNDEIISGNNESEHDYVQRIHDMFAKLDDQVANQLLLNYEDEKGERVLTIEDMNKFYLEKGP